jgi:hypothetical protein
MIVSILIGLTLILSTFISTVSIVQKIAYAQARMEPSINGVSVPNSMTQRSTVVGSNTEPGRNSAVQRAGGGVGALSPAHLVQLEAIRDARSITNGPQVFAQGTHSVDISKVLQKISLVAGLGFIVASLFKFHQHKQNPHQ